MSRIILKAEYERLAGYPSVQNWLNSLSESQPTRTGAMYPLLRFTRYTGRDPEELLADKEAELQKERRFRLEGVFRMAHSGQAEQRHSRKGVRSERASHERRFVSLRIKERKAPFKGHEAPPELVA